MMRFTHCCIERCIKKPSLKMRIKIDEKTIALMPLCEKHFVVFEGMSSK